MPAHRRRRAARHWWIVAGVVGACCAIAAATTALVVTHLGPSSAGASSPPPTAAAPTIAGGAPVLRLLSSTPLPRAANIAPDTAVSVRFTAPLAANSPLPTLDPPVAGSWRQTAPGVLAFEATAPLPPGGTVTLSLPGGGGGIEGAQGQRLAQGTATSFSVAPMTTLRMQQLLATLGYLPVGFTHSGVDQSPAELASDQLGTFAWRWSTLPGNFMALWSPGEPNVVTQGAVMAFESDEHLTSDGVAGPRVWQALLDAVISQRADSYGHYDWVDVTTSLPERVVVWRDGQVAYTSPANTGIEAAPTEIGTWPVYVRYTSTTMSGTNPDGSHYSDPGVPWVSYFHGGDALHGFIRSSYGTPQSLGCVELPPANAEIVYPYTPLGTLVTVQ